MRNAKPGMPARHWERWTRDEEIELLISYYAEGRIAQDVADMLGRTVRAIQSKAWKLSLDVALMAYIWTIKGENCAEERANLRVLLDRREKTPVGMGS